MSNFDPLEVVGRVRETQLQVGENFKFDNFSALRVSVRIAATIHTSKRKKIRRRGRLIGLTIQALCVCFSV